MAAFTGTNLEVDGLSPHSMRTTTATNLLTHNADIAMGKRRLVTVIFQQPGFTTGARCGPKIARLLE